MLRITRSHALPAVLALVLVPMALAVVAVAPPAHAADEPVTWSVEPIATSEGQRRSFTYAVDPGTQVLDSVVITNAGTAEASFEIYATDAINVFETGAFGLLKRDEEPTGVGSWITTASDTITLAPGTQATVPFSLVVPSDATPGDHTAGIVASVVTTGEADGAAVTLEQRVGARVYLEVSGPAEAGVELSGVTSGFMPELNPFAPGTVSLAYELRNTGNQRIDVTQEVSIAGPFGIPLGTYAPEPVTELLPRQSVRVTAEVPAILGLLLAWSTVTAVPAEVGSVTAAAEAGDVGDTEPAADAEQAPAASPAPAATPEPAAPADAASEDAETIYYEPVSSTVATLAVSWTMLAIVVAVIVIALLAWRYVTSTRERMYLAIDQATEAARAEAHGGGSETRSEA